MTTKNPAKAFEKEEVVYSKFEDSIKELMKGHGLYIGQTPDWVNYIKRNNYFDLDGALTGTKELLFFTRPDMNFFSGGSLNADVARNPVIAEIHSMHPKILANLQLSVTSLRSPFMNILTNSVSNTLDLPSISSKDVESAATIYGSKTYFRGASHESDEGPEFTLEFSDTKYLEVYSIIKAYDEYQRMRRLGTVKPPPIYQNMRKHYDQFCIYKFILDSDHTTILFYSKMYGVYFKGVPREAFSEIGNNLIYSVPMKATWVEDMNPLILYEFAKLVEPYTPGLKDLPLYNSVADIPEGAWATLPYIDLNIVKSSADTKNGDATKSHLLRWFTGRAYDPSDGVPPTPAKPANPKPVNNKESKPVPKPRTTYKPGFGDVEY